MEFLTRYKSGGWNIEIFRSVEPADLRSIMIELESILRVGKTNLDYVIKRANKAAQNQGIENSIIYFRYNRKFGIPVAMREEFRSIGADKRKDFCEYLEESFSSRGQAISIRNLFDKFSISISSKRPIAPYKLPKYEKFYELWEKWKEYSNPLAKDYKIIPNPSLKVMRIPNGKFPRKNED
jgi:hypothetical protein